MERFWSKVAIGSSDECWEWQAYRKRGYGQFKLDGRTVMAHRLGYELCVGEIPLGYEVDHLCRNPPCCNPVHLEAVTPRENTLRWQLADGRFAGATHCPRGHSYSEANTYRHGGRRCCRACGRASSLRWYYEHKVL